MSTVISNWRLNPAIGKSQTYWYPKWKGTYTNIYSEIPSSERPFIDSLDDLSKREQKALLMRVASLAAQVRANEGNKVAALQLLRLGGKYTLSLGFCKELLEAAI